MENGKPRKMKDVFMEHQEQRVWEERAALAEREQEFLNDRLGVSAKKPSGSTLQSAPKRSQDFRCDPSRK